MVFTGGPDDSFDGFDDLLIAEGSDNLAITLMAKVDADLQHSKLWDRDVELLSQPFPVVGIILLSSFMVGSEEENGIIFVSILSTNYPTF